MTSILHDLLKRPALPEYCRSSDGLAPGDVAECGCIVSKSGAHLRHGQVWVRREQVGAAQYYGWKTTAMYGTSAGGHELRIVTR